MLQLLGRPSSINVRKVQWLCAELALPLDHQADWATPERPTRTSAFEALNPNALVPVLLDGDFVLWESNTICRHLAARAGRQDLLGDDGRSPALQARARVEQWMDWQATELNTAWRHAFMGLVRQHPDWQDAGGIQASLAAWNRQMTLLDRQLAHTGAYAAGAGFTLADVVLGVSAHRWRSTPQPDRPALPAVQAWLQRLAERPAFTPIACAHP